MCRCNIDVMADDENPEITAALAKLAEQDAAADFLEVAVAGGELVPGRRGWKARQQELVQAAGTSPSRRGPRTTCSTRTSCAAWPSGWAWPAGRAAR